MSDDEYLLPGLFLELIPADEATLHQGGTDSAAIRTDERDFFGKEQSLKIDTADEWNREHLPQFGPPFVRYVQEKFDRSEKLIEKLLAKWSYEPVTVFFVATVNTTAAGAVNQGTSDKAIIYEPAPGWTFSLHRLAIAATGYTFGAPFTAAGSWWELRANDGLILGNSMVAGQGQLPVVGTWGTRDAPHIRDGEVLSFFMSGGPANTTITMRGQGTLERKAEA